MRPYVQKYCNNKDLTNQGAEREVGDEYCEFLPELQRRTKVKELLGIPL